MLSDHAWCEQKAALNAISTITKFPMYEDLAEELTKIAIEELEHFNMVVSKIRERGMELHYEQKDSYVGELAKHILTCGGSKENQLVNRLLFSAMIEARSWRDLGYLLKNLKILNL